MNLRVHAENWLEVMNVATLCSLSEDVHFWADSSICNLRQLSLHIKGEATEILHIYAAASSQIFLNILNERLPYDEILSLGLEWLHAGGGTLGGAIVLSWVLVTIF